MYLALEGIYLLLRAPFSRYTTLWTYVISVRVKYWVTYGAITLYGTVFQRIYTQVHGTESYASNLQFEATSRAV